MGAISALLTAVAVVRRNPVLFAPSLVLSAFGVLSFVPPLEIGAVLGLLLVAFFALPFVIGGTLGMVEEGILGSTAFTTFLREGKEHYRSLLGALLLQLVLFGAVAVGLVVLTFAIVFSFEVVPAVGGFLDFVLGIGFLVLTVLLGLVFVLLLFFLQFYDAAVVVSNEGAVGSLIHSGRFVWRNLLSSIAYSVIAFTISLLADLPLYWSALVDGDFFRLGAALVSLTGSSAASTSPSLPALVAWALLSTVLWTLLSAYRVAFYVERGGR